MMRGGKRAAPRQMALVAATLAGTVLLACVIPGLSTSTPTPIATLTPQVLASATPLPAATPAPGAAAAEIKISEQEMNRWLQGMPTHLGEGIDLNDASVEIHSADITVKGQAQVAQLQGAQIPVEIVLQPVVRDERLSLEVLDVRLGGAYASFSSLIKPLISMGVAQRLDANTYLAEHGMRIAKVELQEGYMVVTSVPAKHGN